MHSGDLYIEGLETTFINPAGGASNPSGRSDGDVLGGHLLSQPTRVDLVDFRPAVTSAEQAKVLAPQHHTSQHQSGDGHSAPKHSKQVHSAKSDDDGLHAAVAHADGTIGPARLLSSPAGFTRAMNAYWQTINSARSKHQFVSAFPPVYKGMDDPRSVPGPVPPPQDWLASAGKLPSLNDLYSAAKDLNRIALHSKSQPDFQVQDISEQEFKKRYAAESVFVGKEFGLDKAHMASLVEHIYAFEDGGWGTHDTLSSMPQALAEDSNKQARLKFHPLSSAIGYNQLLIRDTVSDVVGHGKAISDRLDELAQEHPDRAGVLHAKAQLVSDLQDVLTHKAPPGDKSWDKHDAFHAATAKIEQAVQALNLDGDIGPVIQSQELYNLLKYASENNFDQYLNLKASIETSHAAEYDKLSPVKKQAAIDQLFALIKPAELHPNDPAVDIAFQTTKDSLHRKFLALGPDGKNSPLERDHLNDDDFHMMNSQVLTIRRYGGASGPLSPEARALLDRASSDYFGGFSADAFKAAAIELANLAGMGTAQSMLQPDHSNLPTSNFFARDGYQGNPVTSRRSADELLLQIYRVMHGPNSDPARTGIAQFNAAFNSLDANGPKRR